MGFGELDFIGREKIEEVGRVLGVEGRREDIVCSLVCFFIFDRFSFRKYEERCFGFFLF